jgi:hypothetical protein
MRAPRAFNTFILTVFLCVALIPGRRGATAVAGRNGNGTLVPAAAAPDASDEFFGPFPSWANVKTNFGAIGNGVADDTVALQRGLSELAVAGRSPVLFLPSGTYRVTRTLTLTSAQNIAVIGADPDTTTLVWDGDEGGTMLSLNGVAYSTFSRVTMDGRRRAAIAIDQSWDNQRPTFDTGNQYADDRFLDVNYGIHGGFNGHGFAETSIVRSRFLRNAAAGVALGNFNALDIWIWDSLFDECEAGVTNAPGAGNFHVYSSVFRNSRSSDLVMGNTGGFSVRGNYSRGSRAFFVSALTKAYPAPIHLQRNTIVDPGNAIPIDLKNQGPGLLTDNTILVRTPARGPVVRWSSLDGADVTSVGNTFNVTKPIENNGRLLAIDDRIVPGAVERPSEPALPATPPNRERPIFEVAQNATAREIQKTIDRASLANGKRPVVHLPYGTYAIDQTITIPQGEILLVGDGFRSVLRWSGRGRGPVVRVEGPSSGTIRDLQVDGAGSADGVEVERADAPGGRVFLEQVQLRSSKAGDLFVNGLDETVVEARDLGHAYSPGGPAVRVVGGPRLASGAPAAARTNIFSGASSGNGVSYDVSGGGRVLVRDLWYESGAAPGFANVHDRAVFTVDGSRISTTADTAPPAIDVVGLSGSVAVVASHLDDRIGISGDGAGARVLALGIFDEHESSSYLQNAASPAATAALINSRHKASGRRGNPSVPSPDTGNPTPAFITALLDHTRSQMPGRQPPKSSRAVDVHLVRVGIANSLRNLTITR